MFFGLRKHHTNDFLSTRWPHSCVFVQKQKTKTKTLKDVFFLCQKCFPSSSVVVLILIDLPFLNILITFVFLFHRSKLSAAND